MVLPDNSDANPRHFPRGLLPLLLAAVPVFAQTPDQVLVVVNMRLPASREIGQYYLKRRGVPLANFCAIDTPPAEEITRAVYDKDVEAPIAGFLRSRNLVEQILYIVMTAGVPLKIAGNGAQLRNDAASVDSELTVVYRRLHGLSLPLAGSVNNPFFGQREAPFRHPQFP